MTTTLKNIIIIAAFAFAQPLLAVSPKEMEEARTIAAQAYLRYANNGSGYLDEFRAKSMDELQSKLKAKEKENLKAFNAIPLPTDYASWDKAKLVAYWSDTFFKQPGLDAEGKKAKFRVASRLKEMTIAEPSATEPVATPEQAMPADATSQSDVTAPQAAGADESVAAPESSEPEKPVKEKKSSGGTGIYIAILALLVAVVVCLVVYAINSMKKGNEEPGQPRGKNQLPGQDNSTTAISEGEFNDMHNRFTETLARKNEEIKDLKTRLASTEEKRNQATLAATSAQQEIQAARNDAEQYRLRIAELEATIARLSKENARLQQQASETPAPLRETATLAATPASPVTPRQTASPRRPLPEQKRVIYLGRANARGIFIRADRQPIAGQSVFQLSTSDGMTGTFSVIDSEDTWESALLAPEEMLANACTGRNLRDTRGAVSIATEHSGTAIFEGGCWRVARKAQISYE